MVLLELQRGYDMDIQQWKKRQKELNLTYQQIADKAGVSKRTIEDIFRGFTTSPRIDTVQAIENALGIPSDRNIIDENYLNAISSEEMEVIKKFRKIESSLGKKGCKMIMDFCDMLLENGKNRNR